MKKTTIICLTLTVLVLLKMSIKNNNHKELRILSIDDQLIKQYDIKTKLKTIEAEYQAYLQRQQKWKEARDYHSQKVQEELEQQRKQEEALKTKEVLLEVSFYHDGLITASGTNPQVGRTIACPKEVPFGSVVKFEGKEYICEDRGGYIKKVWSDKYNDYLYRVDVYASSPEECTRLGRYVTRGSIDMN